MHDTMHLIFFEGGTMHLCISIYHYFPRKTFPYNIFFSLEVNASLVVKAIFTKKIKLRISLTHRLRLIRLIQHVIVRFSYWCIKYSYKF